MTDESVKPTKIRGASLIATLPLAFMPIIGTAFYWGLYRDKLMRFLPNCENSPKSCDDRRCSRFPRLVVAEWQRKRPIRLGYSVFVMIHEGTIVS